MVAVIGIYFEASKPWCGFRGVYDGYNSGVMDEDINSIRERVVRSS